MQKLKPELQDSTKKLILFETDYGKVRASLVAQMVKNMPAIQENGFYPWVGKIPLEMELATHSNILPWRILWTEEPGGLKSMVSQRVARD